jgi:hypothetical protein
MPPVQMRLTLPQNEIGSSSVLIHMMLFCFDRFQVQPLYKHRPSKFRVAIEEAFLAELVFLSRNGWGMLTAKVCK